MKAITKDQLLDLLAPYITPHKRDLIEGVLSQRTNYITIALEDIFQPHNASAVLRSGESFGIQQVHIIENRNQYQVNRDVAQGASKWVDLIRYNQPKIDNTQVCLDQLRRRGYRILATTPDPEAKDIDQLALNQKMALFFGTELEGLSNTVLSQADEKVRIPMFGFTESFNISVSAALIMYNLTARLRADPRIMWQLLPEELKDLRLKWYRKIIRQSDLVEKGLVKKLKNLS